MEVRHGMIYVVYVCMCRSNHAIHSLLFYEPISCTWRNNETNILFYTPKFCLNTVILQLHSDIERTPTPI